MIRGAIDTHVHSAPDVRPRKLTDREVAEQAAAAGMRAIVLKSHVTSTADRAAIAEAAVGGPELRVVVPEARRRGVRRGLVTHPELPLVDLDLATQRELAREGAFFERCWQSVAGPSATTPFERIAADIRAIGTSTTMLATDFGRPENPTPARGYADHLDALARAGFAEADLERMACANATTLLGLEAS